MPHGGAGHGRDPRLRRNGAWTIDESRHARECLPPVTYYASSYYEIWIRALETLLDRHGFVTPDERRAGRPLHRGAKPKRILAAADVPAVLARGAPCDRPIVASPRFAPGDRADARDESDRPYPPAPLCPRQSRYDRKRPSGFRLSRCQCAWAAGKRRSVSTRSGSTLARFGGRGRSRRHHQHRCLREFILSLPDHQRPSRAFRRTLAGKRLRAGGRPCTSGASSHG